MFNPVLKELLQAGEVTGADGQRYRISDIAISSEEGELLHSLITRYGCTRTLEVGCAFGISSLYICNALSRFASPRHAIIDPFQNSHFYGMGLAHLDRAGFDFYEFHEELSELALPTLLAAGRKFDFAFIDGVHTLDHALLDFFYFNRMLEVGGVVAIDDLHLEGVRKAANYVLRYPCYELEAVIRAPTAHPVKRWVRRYADRKRTLEMRGAGASCIALRKTAPDTRGLHWPDDYDDRVTRPPVKR